MRRQPAKRTKDFKLLRWQVRAIAIAAAFLLVMLFGGPLHLPLWFAIVGGSIVAACVLAICILMFFTDAL